MGSTLFPYNVTWRTVRCLGWLPASSARVRRAALEGRHGR